MGKSLLQVYALTVCFATLMCLVVALGIGIYDVVQVASPGFTVQEHMLWQSDEHFLLYHPDKKGLPPDELKSLREQHRQAAMETERRGALQSLVFMGIIIAIDVAVYAVHWTMACRFDPTIAASTSSA